MSTTTLTYECPPMLLGGEWRSGRHAQRSPVRNPANGELLGELGLASTDDLQLALQTTQKAFEHWRQVPAHDRCARLERGVARLRENTERIATLLTLEQGKPLAEGKGEVAYAASYIEWFGEEATRMNGEVSPAPVPGRRMFALKEPVGVVAAITPWNFPAAMIARKIAPALAAGCTVVAKPAEDTPLTALEQGR